MAVTFYPNLIHYAGFDASAEPGLSNQNYACSGGETTGPGYDLVDNRRDNVLTFDTNGEADNPVINMVMTTAYEINFVIVDNHNFNTADADLLIVYNWGTSTDTLTGHSAWSGTLGSALSAETISNYRVLVPADGICLNTFTAATDEDWGLEIPDNDDDNFNADVTLGEIAIGKSFSPAHSPEINIVSSYRMPGYTNISGGGQKYGYAIHTNYQRAWRLNWQFMSDANKTSLENIFKYTNGTQYPFYIDLGEAATPQLYYVRFVPNSLDFTQLTNDAWAVTVAIEEEI